MSQEEPLFTIIIPKLPPCPICLKHQNRLVRVDVFGAKTEYYLYCEECERSSWVMIDILCPEEYRKDGFQWLQQLDLWTALIRKNYSS